MAHKLGGACSKLLCQIHPYQNHPCWSTQQGQQPTWFTW